MNTGCKTRIVHNYYFSIRLAINWHPWHIKLWIVLDLVLQVRDEKIAVSLKCN